MKPIIALIAAAALVAGVAGCGEKPSVTVYKQGHYSGKPDKQPWDNEKFKDDRTAWENAIKARNQSQNEYVRIGGG